jgi:hypothetical protein
MTWAIYSKETDQPLWLGDNAKDLVTTMGELNRSLGDRFYLGTYSRSENEATDK